MGELGAPGFFGKIPSRGDFVSRRLPREFIDVWDVWLQDALATSRGRLGAQWLDIYLTSPVWCFVLAPGVCGQAAYAGVLMPSVDKVGRYFPLVAALPCDPEAPSLAVRDELAPWFERTQDLLLATLEEPGLDLDEFDERLADLRAATSSMSLDWTVPSSGEGGMAWHFLVPEGAAAAPLGAAILSELLARDFGAHSVWWTAGSERVPPTTLMISGLPPASAFAAMLDGDFSDAAWTRGVLRRAGDADTPVRYLSAAVSDKGKVRAVNEDSFACRDDAGVWLVADGLGGHEAGDVASAMVAAVPQQLSPAMSLELTVERLTQGLRVVNDCLRVLAERAPDVSMAASTVAALVAKGNRVAVLWAGDSRVYRLRDGRLDMLTRDHSDTPEPLERDASEEPANRAITRAVGGTFVLDLDVVYDVSRPLDRYLLCTDGLYGALSEEDIVRELAADGAGEAGDALVKRVLEGPAADNLTGVVVHCLGDELPRDPDGSEQQ